MDKIIREHFCGCTVVAVTHRLDHITEYEKVAVLDQGRLVEYDRPGVLLGRENSALSALVQGNDRPW